MVREFSLISSMATKAILAELAQAFTETTGTQVSLLSIGGVEAIRRIRGGLSFDVALLASGAMQALARDGFIDGDTHFDFAASATAIAVRAGAASEAGGPAAAVDEAAIKDLIGQARSIGVSTGPSGQSIMALLQSWGIYEAIKARIVQAPPGVPVAQLIARGDVQLGFQQLSELMGQPGIQILGAVPESLLPLTIFAGGLQKATLKRAEAAELMHFLASEPAASVKRKYGMEPC